MVFLQVEKILNLTVKQNQLFYLIRWKGYGPKYDSWEPEENLECDEAVDEFMKSLQTNRTPSRVSDYIV